MKDKTATLVFNEDTVVKENHIFVTCEPDGQYRHHFTPGPPDKTQNKPAILIAQELHSWMVEYGIDKTVKVLGGDSTNDMSVGSIAWMERLLGRNVFWVIYNLYTNKLPLRHLISALNVLKEMSTDAALSYRLLKAIRSGKLIPELANMKCGEICHSRWLSTGESLMMLWMSEHNFTRQTLKKLKLIVNFVCNVYFHMFYKIKVKHNIFYEPNHVVTQLRLLQSRPLQVVKIVSPYIQTGAWFAHSEAILLSLLASSTQAERKFAVEIVLKMRREDEYGSMLPRPRRTPELNFKAKRVQDLILWDKEHIHEPVFTCKLTKTEIRDIINNPLKVDYSPLHTQSTERAVKLVTEASCTACGAERRHGFILARNEHRHRHSPFS